MPVDRNFCGLLGGVKRLFFYLKINGRRRLKRRTCQCGAEGGGILGVRYCN